MATKAPHNKAKRPTQMTADEFQQYVQQAVRASHTTPKRRRRAVQRIDLREMELAPVLAFLRELIAAHPPTGRGQCPTCGHYGRDCHGSKAAALLADLTGGTQGTRVAGETAPVCTGDFLPTSELCTQCGRTSDEHDEHDEHG